MKKSKSDYSIPDDYDYLNVSSATDCTGLIPAGPFGEAELESYEQLYPFLPKAVCVHKEKEEE